MHRFSLAACSILLTGTLALPEAALAQDPELRAVVLPVVSGSGGVPLDARGVALSVLRQALVDLEIEVATVEELPDLPEPLRACETGPCVQELVRRTNADFAAALALWAPAEAPTHPDNVVVSLIDNADQSFDARNPVEGELADAIRQAARVAHSHYRVGPGPFLFVDGTPDAAIVQVDGTVAGSLPFRERIETGTHEIRVSAEGHRPESRTVAIPTDITSTTRLRFDLEPAAGEPSVLNWILAAAGLGVGLGLLVPPIINLGLNGQCADESMDGCRTQYLFDDARDGTLFAVAGAFLVAGVVFLAAQPIRVSASTSSEGAWLQLEGTF